MSPNEQRPRRPNPRGEAAKQDHQQRIDGEPLRQTIVERMDYAMAQLAAIKTPSASRSHPRAATIYLYLVYHADASTGTVTRSMATIAKAVGCKERQVSECLTLLIALGLITRRRNRRAGQHSSSTYTLRRIASGSCSPVADNGSTIGSSSPSPPAVHRSTTGSSSPGNQEENQGTPSGLSNRVARERGREGLRGEDEARGVIPAATGHAGGNGATANGTRQDSPSQRATGSSSPVADDHQRSSTAAGSGNGDALSAQNDPSAADVIALACTDPEGAENVKQCREEGDCDEYIAEMLLKAAAHHVRVVKDDNLHKRFQQMARELGIVA